MGNSLGTEKYVECVTEEETRAEVEQDIKDATEVGVQGTPTFMVNGEFLVCAQSELAFESIFEEDGLGAD